mgnify:CR=1 FL=1
MGQVDISINGRNYQVACDDGQEQHLGELGEVVNEKVAALAASAGQIGESRLLLMASLLIADDLADSLRKLKDVEVSGADAVQVEPAPAPVPTPAAPAYDEEALCRGLEMAAQRMESIAEMLEQS